MATTDFIDYNTLLGAGKKAANSVSSLFNNDQAQRYDQLQNADAFKSTPSAAAFAAMGNLGINPNTQFGQEYALQIGQRLNNAYDFLGPGSMANVGDDDTKRAQFMLDYSKALLQGPSNPLYLDYNEVGQQLQNMLASGGENLGGLNLKTADAGTQFQGIMDYINTIGFQAMSPERMKAMQFQLGTIFADYSSALANGSTGGVDFLGYLVQRSADFLDMFFGDQGWSYTDNGGNPNTGPVTITPGGSSGSGDGALYQGAPGSQVTRYSPAIGLPGTPLQSALGAVTYIDGKPYYSATFDPTVNDQRRNFPYRSDF